MKIKEYFLGETKEDRINLLRGYLGLLIILILCINSVTALDSLGTFKVNEPVRITQVCSDSSYINISSIAYPNSSTAISNIIMTSAGSGEYYYDFLNTTQIGRYDVRGISNGCEKTFAIYFDVTPSGQEMTEGKTGILILSIIVMLVISSFFFILGVRSENLGAKIILVGTTGILLVATFLYSLVGLEQVLGGFSNITEGYATFWMVLKIILGIAILGLTLFAGYLSWSFWQIKRGYRD